MSASKEKEQDLGELGLSEEIKQKTDKGTVKKLEKSPSAAISAHRVEKEDLKKSPSVSKVEEMFDRGSSSPLQKPRSDEGLKKSNSGIMSFFTSPGKILRKPPSSGDNKEKKDKFSDFVIKDLNGQDVDKKIVSEIMNGTVDQVYFYLGGKDFIKCAFRILPPDQKPGFLHRHYIQLIGPEVEFQYICWEDSVNLGFALGKTPEHIYRQKETKKQKPFGSVYKKVMKNLKSTTLDFHAKEVINIILKSLEDVLVLESGSLAPIRFSKEEETGQQATPI